MIVERSFESRGGEAGSLAFVALSADRFELLRPCLKVSHQKSLSMKGGSPALCYNLASEETTLANLSGVMKELSKERSRLHQQLSGLNAALEAFAGVYRGNNGTKLRRKMSAKGRASIAAAQRARWAKAKGITEVPKRRTMPASARRKIAAAQRARWAKARKAK